MVAGSFTRQRCKATWFHNRWGTGHCLAHFLVRGVDRRWVASVTTLHFAASQSVSRDSRQGRPKHFSSAPCLEHTDHDLVELRMRVGKDWLGEARRREEVAPRPDVLRFLSSSAEARALRGSYASKVSEELSFVSGTKLDWEVLADVMKKSAFAVVGPTPRRHKKPWLQGKESEIRVLESEVHRVSELLRRAKGCGSGEVPFLADARRGGQ